MRSSAHAVRPLSPAERRPLAGFLFAHQEVLPSQLTARPAVRPRTLGRALEGLLEPALSLSGLGLGMFMVMHLGLLSTVLASRDAFDALAGFLEDYYLLQAFVPALIALILAHVVLAARKAPNSFEEQRVLFRQMRWLSHLDTWTWALQVVTGIALLAMVSIHLWVILTELPVEAERSASHVAGSMLGFDAPFLPIVQAHLALGLYRIALKWGLLSRAWAYRALAIYLLVVLGLSSAVMATFYRIGGGS